MEDFEKLLDDYLNFDDYEMKEDFEEQKVCKHRTESPFSKEDAISIDKYVNAFLGYQMDCSTLYHQGLKQLELDCVIGVDNNFANKNVDYVKKGLLLIVLDAKGKRGTYVNPVYIRKYLEREDLEQTYKEFLKKKLIGFEKLQTYYNKYLEAQRFYDEISRFTQLIKETHKEAKIKKLERRKHD